jgi:catechol 2,3-dioxygenase-like lactoylglutathione lyase family enzyme
MPDPAASVRKFHLSVNVSDLARSVAFYEVLFGKPPEKHHADYAKFALEDPPAVFSLVPGRSGQGGALNHVGLCLLTAEELVAIQHRLEAAGHKTLREDGVACCYSRQTKFWVRDPDGILLELYIFHGDLEDDDDHDHSHAGDDLPTLMGGGKEDEPAPTLSWTHQLGTPLEAAAALETNSHQEIILEGSLNDSLDLAALLREARRALKPGGKISLHGLAADRVLEDTSPSLPGPAAAVKRVPDFPSLSALLQAAGFSGIKFTKLSERGYFQHEGVPLREVLIEAVKPGFRPTKKDQHVVYLGPLAALEDDHGNRFVRGQPTLVNIHDWQALKKSHASFALLESAVQPIVCGNHRIDL